MAHAGRTGLTSPIRGISIAYLDEGQDDKGWRVAFKAARRGRVRSRLSWTLAALAGFALLTACGSSDYTYVTNETENTYFKVPASWQRLDGSGLRKMFAKANPDSIEQIMIDRDRWVVAYDSSATPDLAHVPLTAGPIKDPVVLAVIVNLNNEESGTFSLDHMRNYLWPTTPSAVAEFKQRLEEQDLAYNVEVLAEAAMAPTKELHGIRRLYNVKVGDLPLETQDMTVLVNNDETKLYLFLLRCATACWQSRQQELLDIAGSFTVVGRN